LLFARVDNGVTKFSPKSHFGPKLQIFKILDQKKQFEFSMGNFHFFGRGRTNLNFFGRGYDFKTG